MSVARRLAALLLAGGCLFAGAATAQAAASPDPNAPPKGDPALRDPVFRVHGAEFGLARRVEMYQWVPRDDGFARGWSASPVVAGDGEGDGGHANPPFPLESDRWLPAAVTVDGVPLAPEVLEQLGTWSEFRPGFSSLPGNLSATFQPEGNGLGSAENPLEPQVGDLRIHWLQRTLPPLGERIELRDGQWVLRADAPPVEQAVPRPRAWLLSWLPILLGGGGLLVLAIVLARRRK